MAAALRFDTLDYARKLEMAGVAAPQAEAQARVLAEALSQAVASPDDLKVLESSLGSRISSLDAKIDGVESRLEARIDKVGSSVDTLKWLFGVVAAMNVAVFVRLVLHP